MSKRCRVCGVEMPLSEFHRAAGMRDGHRNECKECYRRRWKELYDADPERRRRALERALDWQARNPERHAENLRRRNASPQYKRSMRASHLKRKYGITIEDYEAMLAAQGGGCAICCALEPDGQSLHVDHCHDSGRVRGLLCFNCNAGLGKFGERADLLETAVAYLRR